MWGHLRTRWISPLIGLLLGLFAVGGTAAADVAVPVVPAPAGDELVLGRISDDPKAHYGQLKPLLDYVVPRLQSVGITHGRILMAKDAQQMASYLRHGRVDWVTETPGTALELQRRAGARPLLLTERNGVSRYHSLFFVRRDSGITSLQQLKGRSIVFQSLASTSAYLVPAAMLLGEERLSLEQLLSPRDKPVAGDVGYVFARSELNVATWVDKRVVDAGVLSSLDWDNPQHVPPTFKRDFVVLRETADYPRALELVRNDLDPKVEARLREVLLQAASDPKAGPALRSFFGTTRFLPMDAQSMTSLQRLGSGAARVHEQLE